MLSLKAKILCVPIIAIWLSVAVAQDFEPDPLETDVWPMSTTTTTVKPAVTATDSPFTTTTTTIPETINPPSPTTTTPEPANTLTPTTTAPDHTTTRPPTTTDEPPTTTTEPPTTTAEPPTTTEPWTTTTTTSRPWTGYPYNPWMPLYPTTKPPYHEHHHYHKHCYYREQSGAPYLKWSCGRLHYEYPKYCYYCCLYLSSGYAGCTQVDHRRCSPYNYPYNYLH